YAETRPGEGLAPDDVVGQSQLRADGADLVLEQGAQRLDELEGEVLGQAPHVVVALDVRRALAAAGLDDVRVQGALDQERLRRRGRRVRLLPRPLDDALLAQDDRKSVV